MFWQANVCDKWLTEYHYDNLIVKIDLQCYNNRKQENARKYDHQGIVGFITILCITFEQVSVEYSTPNNKG